MVGVLEPIWHEIPEVAKKLKQALARVFEWARDQELYIGDNPASGKIQGLGPQRTRTKHHAAAPIDDLPRLWTRLCDVGGIGPIALRFLILTAARSGEVRKLRWSEVDPSAALWVIPAEKMKGGREHRVPLSPAALALLESVAPLRRDPDDLVFPNAKGTELSDATLARVLDRLAVEGRPHGMRSSFRDWATEIASTNHPMARDLAELSLAHQVGDEVERAYARSDLLARRRALLDDWAAFVTGADPL
ncbi:MAG: site-specific integrase [Pseudomonadota bacterium]